MSQSYAGVEDLLCDETFLSWYFKKDVRAVQQWQQWMAEKPGSSARIEQAVAFLQSLHLEERGARYGQISLAERLLLEKIRRVGKGAQAPVMILSRKGWMVAASVLVITAGIYFFRPWQPRIHTNYGEIKGTRLPDGTEVVVNANTHLLYSSGWKDGKDREVWLRGEAFFHVSKTPLKSRFIVHANHFDIIVTGTQFNVVSRKEKENVLLQEGSVTLHTAEGEEWKMKAGDFVEYNHEHLSQRPAKGDSVIAWKDHKLSFDNTALRDVATVIEEQYGIHVRLANEAVGNKTVSGIMPNNNLDILLQALEATTDFRVIREDKEIIIQDHQN